MKLLACLTAVLLSLITGLGQPSQPLPETTALTLEGDLSAQMVGGISGFLDQQTAKAAAERAKLWHRDFSSREAYDQSIRTNREHLRVIIGATDPRLPLDALEIISSTANPALVAETDLFQVRAVRWPVFDGVYGEGLWLKPKQPILARVVVVPDADQTPEMLAGLAPGLAPERQFARRLAEHGCEVLVPLLLSRDDTFSGSEKLNRHTNQPHREWIYRQAYEMGRHIIGYEVQKVLAAIDFFAQTNSPASETIGTRASLPLGVAGYAEGGLIAFYAAALDSRINATLVSGYFDSRQRVWQEPIYRNVFGLLREFGDAEVATLIALRALVVEHSRGPEVTGPPSTRQGRSGAAPGKLGALDFTSVETEFQRALSLLSSGGVNLREHWDLISGNEGMTTGPFSDRALVAFLKAIGIPANQPKPLGPAPVDSRTAFDPSPRQQRQVRALEDFTQRLLRDSDRVRQEFFWNHIASELPALRTAAAQAGSGVTVPAPEAVEDLRRVFREDIIGSFGPAVLPLNPRARQILERPKWTAYEVVLDVYPGVFAWGCLLLPKDLRSGERRPVVVCQHGLEGLPSDTFNGDPNTDGFGYYKNFAARLAERGFIVFSPHNPYRGRDKFRELQRKANPLGCSLFSIIIAQHARILEWLNTLPFVDGKKIGFYGLSYGGKTAMRVPAVLDGYCLSICSGDFNDWVRKNATVDSPISYMFTGEYEMPEWNLGQTFNYAEMAALIAPRPFMVERGHNDGVGLDEWVAFEYAKVRRFYDQLGIPDRTAIEFFNGPHTINGMGTFDFLHKHLAWPAP
jgi:dienelactone hydrolase